jgi:hypothetical protein
MLVLPGTADLRPVIVVIHGTVVSFESDLVIVDAMVVRSTAGSST